MLRSWSKPAWHIYAISLQAIDRHALFLARGWASRATVDSCMAGTERAVARAGGDEKRLSETLYNERSDAVMAGRGRA